MPDEEEEGPLTQGDGLMAAKARRQLLMTAAPPPPQPLTNAWVCIAAYCTAVLVAWGSWEMYKQVLNGVSDWFIALLADVAATFAVFAFSAASDNSSMYDPFWMVAPPLLCLKLKYEGSGLVAPWHARQVLGVLLVFTWSLRFHVRSPWPGWRHGLAHEDFRYTDYRAKLPASPQYWAFSLLSFHFIPTLIVFFALAPLALVLLAPVDQPSLGMLDVAGFLIGACAITVEAVADEQLARFRRTAAASEPCVQGLWRYSRHPNYFGEVPTKIRAPRTRTTTHTFDTTHPRARQGLFWLSLLPFAVSARLLLAAPWIPLGPSAMLAMLRFASVPMMDERSLMRCG